MNFASNLPHPLLSLTLAIGRACSSASQAQERGIEELFSYTEEKSIQIFL